MNRDIKILEPDAPQRRIFFHLVGLDGITPATGETGGQPQISINGAAFSNTGIGVLVAIGFGRYYADLTQAILSAQGLLIETRYKSANTAEIPGDSAQVVGIDFNGMTANTGLAVAATTTTVTLATTAVAILDYYVGNVVTITGGTGKGQTRVIQDYTATRIITVSRPWVTVPDTTSTYAVTTFVSPRLDSNLYVTTGALSTTAQTNVQTAMTAQGYTTTRAGFLDTLNGLVLAIWSAASRTLSAFDFGVSVNVNNDKTGYALSTIKSTSLYNGTSVAGNTTTTISLGAVASSDSNAYVRTQVKIYAGAGTGQIRNIVSYNGSTKVATILTPWVVVPNETSKFIVLAISLSETL